MRKSVREFTEGDVTEPKSRGIVQIYVGIALVFAFGLYAVAEYKVVPKMTQVIEQMSISIFKK